MACWMPAGGGGGKPGGVARSGNTVGCLEKVQNPRGWMFWGFFHLPFIRSVRRAAPSRRVVGRRWWAGARSCRRSAARCGRGIRSCCGCREGQTQRAEAGAARRVQRGGEEPGGSRVCRQGAGVQESTVDCSELQAVSSPGGGDVEVECLGPSPGPGDVERECLPWSWPTPPPLTHTHTRTHTLWAHACTHTCTHCGHARAHTHTRTVGARAHTHIHTHWACTHTRTVGVRV